MHIHVLGVCGTFMGGIARLAAASGHQVSGTDTAFYEPMASQLTAAGIDCHTGYQADLSALAEADLYIVGNVIRRGNPTLEALLRAGAACVSGPQWLAEHVLADRQHVIAIAGTHGKTTTTALVIHILERCGHDPGYLIGGVPRAAAPSAIAGGGEYFVLEADEYDTAFFDKRPKFTHYWATVYVLNNIEFDHADIYPDLATIERQFALLPRHVKPGGTVVANWADARVQHAVPPQSWHTIVPFNAKAGLHWQGNTLVDGTKELGAATKLPPGKHNHANALAALAACHAVGVSYAGGLAALADFELPARRLQVLYERDGITVIDDFAHHPTAIRATLSALAQLYPAARLVAALEPRSNTMRAGHWQEQLADCLSGAERVYALSDELAWDLAAALAPLGERAVVCADAQALQQQVLGELSADDVLVFLSNGDFGGLRQSLPQQLAQG